jgi:hypothetical protein
MTDEHVDEPLGEPEVDIEEPADLEDFEAEIDAEFDDLDTTEILMHASMDRLHRQAYMHGTSKQLFTFLFANCLFFAGCLVAWTRGTPGDPPGDPSTYITGLHTIRGAMIFALSIYGFWTAVFNIFNGQMKVWPYLVSGVLALWVGVGAFAHGIGGPAWKKAGEHLDSLESKKVLDDILVRFSVIAPGFWLLTMGGLIVVWVILSGLMKGAQQSKEAATADSGGSGRRRR